MPIVAAGVDRVDGMLRVGAGLATSKDPRAAAAESALAARVRSPGTPPTLAVVFASPHHTEAGEALLDAVHEAVSPEALIGCVGEAVVGGAREVEGEPAVAVWLAWLPAPAMTYHATFEPMTGAIQGFPETAGGVHVLVADPFTFPADGMLERLPGTTIVGGLASGAIRPGETRLFLGDRVLREGAVGAVLPPGVRVRTLVSQGCRPVGAPMVVTRVRGNLIEELAGQPPLERIRETYAAAGPADRARIEDGLLLGRVIREGPEQPSIGDYLIRAVLGADRSTGAIAVGDEVAVGETVRFHVRDADSADADLRATLDRLEEGAAGALLFTCNGRGSRMFGAPDHDAALVSASIGDPAVAGFFCAGELGPVGARSFLHGFTASLAVLYE